jgi:peptidoglycan-N-acetylglucosamine deacetylase
MINVTAALTGWLSSNSNGADLDTLAVIGAYWLMFQTIDVLSAIYAIRLSGDRSHLPLVPLLILQRFTYRQILYFIAVRSLVAAFKGRFVGWGKLVRTGSVVLSSIKGAEGLAARSQQS